MVSYSTSFGNDSDSSTRIMGSRATLVNIGGEGSQRWDIVEEKGNHEANPHRSHKFVQPGARKAVDTVIAAPLVPAQIVDHLAAVTSS